MFTNNLQLLLFLLGIPLEALGGESPKETSSFSTSSLTLIMDARGSRKSAPLVQSESLFHAEDDQHWPKI